MTIAAHIDLLKDNSTRFWQCITRLAQQNPSDHFILFTQDNTLPIDFFSGNCTIVPVSPVIKNSLLLHYWYNLKLPGLLRKYNADVFISPNSTVSFRTDKAQIMLVADDFIWQKNYPLKNDFGRYLKKYFTGFINKAAAIMVTSAFLGQRLFERYPGMEQKTQILPLAIEQVYQPLLEERKIAIRQNLTEGHEYYYFECSPLTQPNMMAVVKAFSIFKKRLKTGMQLLVLNKLKDNPIKDFHIYKYRNEVKLVPYTSEKDTAVLLAAAYAAIYLPAFVAAQPTGLNALQAGVSLITPALENNSSLYNDAVLYTGTDEKMIAESMMLLYKDEAMKNKLIKLGTAVTAPYNMEHNSDLLWQTILNCSGA